MRSAMMMLVVLAAACGKDGGKKKATCEDVEAAMRRIEPERTKDLRPGIAVKLCKSRPEEFTQERMDCMVAAKSSRDLAVCAGREKAAEAPAPGATTAPTWRQVPSFGVQVEVPGDVTVEENKTNAHVGNGTFKLNLFLVDELSSKSAADQKASLQKEPGFVKFTKEEMGDKTWRFDYELEGGKAGTSARINPGRELDCGVHKVAPDIAAAVGGACAGAKAL